MRRVLFQWRGIKIYAYPAMLYLGTVLGVIGGCFAAALHGLDPRQTAAAMLLLVLPALVGSRLLYVASHWPAYRREPRRIWRRSEGGAAMYGGLVLAFLVSLPLLGVFGISVGAFWDAATLTILIGMIFTRVGCLLNGCCAGRPTKAWFSLYLPNVHGIWCRRLPTQLLEAGLAVVLLLGSIWAWNRLPFNGALFLANLAAYGVGRWWLETARETIDTIGSVRLNRAISLGLVALSLGILVGITLLRGRWELTNPPEFDTGATMSEWSFVLAPLAVLAVLLLFRFVGCYQIVELGDYGSGTKSYADEVRQDNPVAYWRLQDTGPPTATDDTGNHNGTYTVPSPPIPRMVPGSVGGDVLLYSQTGILTDGSTAISVRGGYISVPNGSGLTQYPFALEVLISPEGGDWATTGNLFTLFSSNQQQAAQPAGFVLYAGPVDPSNPQSDYHWQVWVGTDGSQSGQPQWEQLKEIPTNRAGDPGLKVENKPTYLVLTFDGTTFVLYYYVPDGDHSNLDWLTYPLFPPTSGNYVQNDPNADLLIGVDGPFPNQSLAANYPFEGRIEEVAVYQNQLPSAIRLAAHGSAAFHR
jgi:phosphatidylglycerol:prolipoprotein diacylglycerol transferase